MAEQHPANLTPTQQRIWTLLSDGRIHSIDAIFDTCIDDELAQKRNIVYHHMCLLRLAIKNTGFAIVNMNGSYVRISGRKRKPRRVRA